MDQTEENEEADVKDDFTRGIAYFWRSTNLEPHIRSVAFREGISKVALGNHHTLLLTFNSQVLSVGDNSFGQLGLGDLKSRREPTVIDYLREKPVHEISCGGQHSGVICDNRDVFFGEIHLGDNAASMKQALLTFLRLYGLNGVASLMLEKHKKMIVTSRGNLS